MSLLSDITDTASSVLGRVGDSAERLWNTGTNVLEDVAESRVTEWTREQMTEAEETRREETGRYFGGLPRGGGGPLGELGGRRAPGFTQPARTPQPSTGGDNLPQPPSSGVPWTAIGIGAAALLGTAAIVATVASGNQ